MRTTESVLKIQKGLIDKYNENDVYNSSAMSLMDIESSAITQMDTNEPREPHHPDNDTMIILENVEMGSQGSRKNTSLYMNDMNELLANYKDTFHSLTKLRKQSSAESDFDPEIKPINKSCSCSCRSTSILLWILLTYSVLCSTYFLFCIFFQSENLFFLPNSEQSINLPIFIPTASPTLAIENIMISSEPTLEPTLEPTKRPWMFDRHFVGDYKVSAQLQSHGPWLLCDGALYNISDYTELFGIIGYVFTAKDISDHDNTLFAVPDARDKVIGVYDDTKHLFGDVIGTDWINLTRSNLPSHSHYLINVDSIDTNNMNVSNVKFDHGYIVYGGNGEETNGLKSSATGDGQPFSSYQPTIFMGNAFIYS